MNLAEEEVAESGVPPISPWEPLRTRRFREVWIANFVSNIGGMMQGVGAGWLMTLLSASPLLVSLVPVSQTAAFLVLAYPSGTLADRLDRRWILLGTQIWMFVLAAVLACLTWTGMMTPPWLLGLTFLMAIGAGIYGPAWQATVREFVPENQLPEAIALNSMGFNGARACGPALGGLMVAAFGPATAFAVNSLSFLGVISVFVRLDKLQTHKPDASESFFRSMVNGCRHAFSLPRMRAAIIAVCLFMFPSSVMWSLAPLVAKRVLGLGAWGYGMMVTTFGIGAFLAALFLPSVRAKFRPRSVVQMGFLCAAAGFALSSSVPLVAVVFPGVAAVGAGWISVMSTLNVVVQTSPAEQMQARALGLYFTLFHAALAAGGISWGLMAGQVGERGALALAALVLVIGTLVVRRLRF